MRAVEIQAGKYRVLTFMLKVHPHCIQIALSQNEGYFLSPLLRAVPAARRVCIGSDIITYEFLDFRNCYTWQIKVFYRI